MRNSPHLFAALFLALCSSGSTAAGMFDFLDPCIAAKDDFWDSRSEMMSQVERELDTVPGESASSEFRDFWWQEKKILLREYFMKEIGAIIVDSGGDVDKAFEIWLAIKIEKQGGMKAMDPLIDAEYRKTKTLVLQKNKGDLVAALDKTKNELYDGCPSDVGNQVFRGAVTVLTAPVNIAIGNFEGAKRESGEIDKLLRAITGVSVKDIKEYGVCGGSNSEMRKLFGSLC